MYSCTRRAPIRYFMLVPDYLRAADRAWDFIEDRTFIISRDLLEQLLNESFESL